MRALRTLGMVGLLLVAPSGCAAAAAGAAGTVARQAAASGVWVEVSPGTTTAGFKLSVRADCGDNSNAATVTSAAFGTLTVQPWNTLLLADVTVPQTTKPGTYEVKITCRTGSSGTTTLTIIAGEHPAAGNQAPAAPGPHTGGGFLAAGGESGSSGTRWFDAPTTWLFGSATALLLAGLLGAVSFRRRRVRVR